MTFFCIVERLQCHTLPHTDPRPPQGGERNALETHRPRIQSPRIYNAQSVLPSNSSLLVVPPPQEPRADPLRVLKDAESLRAGLATWRCLRQRAAKRGGLALEIPNGAEKRPRDLNEVGEHQEGEVPEGHCDALRRVEEGGVGVGESASARVFSSLGFQRKFSQSPFDSSCAASSMTTQQRGYLVERRRATTYEFPRLSVVPSVSAMTPAAPLETLSPNKMTQTTVARSSSAAMARKGWLSRKNQGASEAEMSIENQRARCGSVPPAHCQPPIRTRSPLCLCVGCE
jgi:hypothetical protein